MSNRMKYFLCLIFIVTALYIVGCSSKYMGPEPSAAQTNETWPPARNFDRQADNAVLTSMSVTDVLFLPYRSELNSLGQARLTAIASYLLQYGGEVTVDSRQTDEVTRQQRLAAVREFLLAQGLVDEQLTIVTGLPHGRGQDITEATIFYAKNLLPAENSSSSGTGKTATPTAMSAGSKQ